MPETLLPAYELSDQLDGVVADGAGTLVDPESKVPALAFQVSYTALGLTVDLDTIMEDMGSDKRAHIWLVLRKPILAGQVRERYPDGPQESDVDDIYDLFQKKLIPLLEETAEIDGVEAAARELKEAGIPLIWTTGYNDKMFEAIKRALPWLGDVLTHSVTSSDEAGRPKPDMIHNAMRFVNKADPTKMTDPNRGIKVGDTEVDVRAADNAKMPGILVTTGSITSEEKAREINQRIGRKHLVVPTFVEIVKYAIDRTLQGRIGDLNK